MLYRPWRLEEAGHSLQMIFRDHALSDHIGFHYQRYQPQEAVDDLLGKLESIQHAIHAVGGPPALVSIILDGENCWEYYENGGLEFLRGLYSRLARHMQIKPVRVCDYLEKHPADKTLGRLFAGSWISHNFGIWIGHPACNRAWDLLSETRAVLVERAAAKTVAPDALAHAWNELFIAEGSDWFWWFDDQHTSSQDGVFDELFRRHLQNVYTLLELDPPATLLRPITDPHRQHPATSQPTSLLDVQIDGRVTYFEWLNAGHFSPSMARGAMTMVEPNRIEQVRFGFDQRRLLIRLDALGGTRARLADVERVRIVFAEPEGFELLVRSPASARPTAQLFHNDVPVSAADVEAACDTALEIAIPWRDLGAATDAPIRYCAELVRCQQVIERIPAEGMIETSVPSPDFELIMWQA